MPSLAPITTDSLPPRPRRSSRPVPFTSTAPPPHTPHHAPPPAPIVTTPERQSYFPPTTVDGSASAKLGSNGYPASTSGSRQSMGRGWQREVAVELHGCLYGGERQGRRGEEVRELVEEAYANEAGKSIPSARQVEVGGWGWATFGLTEGGVVQCSRTQW